MRYGLPGSDGGISRATTAARPVAEGLLAITGGFLGRDLRRGERTLAALGLASMTRAQLPQLLHDGE